MLDSESRRQAWEDEKGEEQKDDMHLNYVGKHCECEYMWESYCAFIASNASRVNRSEGGEIEEDEDVDLRAK